MAATTSRATAIPVSASSASTQTHSRVRLAQQCMYVIG